jgi:hypothetical protein
MQWLHNARPCGDFPDKNMPTKIYGHGTQIARMDLEELMRRYHLDFIELIEMATVKV